MANEYLTAGVLLPTPLKTSIAPIFWFPPAGISGADGADMTTWTDFGPNGYVPAAFSGAGNRPTVKKNAINGQTAAANDGTKNGLQIPSTPGITLTSKDTWTLFAVVQWAGTGSGGYASLANGLNFGFRVGLQTTSDKALITYPNVGNFISGSALSLNIPHCIIFRANASVMDVTIDGAATSLGTNSMTATSFPCIFDLCTAVENQQSTFAINGYLPDIAFYNGALNSADLALLRAYAKSIYGTG